MTSQGVLRDAIAQVGVTQSQHKRWLLHVARQADNSAVSAALVFDFHPVPTKVYQDGMIGCRGLVEVAGFRQKLRSPGRLIL
jgi:hypothetical protein